MPITLFDRHEETFVDPRYGLVKGRTLSSHGHTSESETTHSTIESEDDVSEVRETVMTLPLKTWTPAQTVVSQTLSGRSSIEPSSHIGTLSYTPRRNMFLSHTYIENSASFLSHLPKCTIKAGKIIDVRGGIADLLNVRLIEAYV